MRIDQGCFELKKMHFDAVDNELHSSCPPPHQITNNWHIQTCVRRVVSIDADASATYTAASTKGGNIGRIMVSAQICSERKLRVHRTPGT